MELSNEYRRKRYPKDIVAKPAIVKVSEKTPVKVKIKDKRKWAATEATISFNFIAMVDKVKTHVKANFSESSPEEIITIIGNNLKAFTINDQIFEYINVPNNFGGVRWFVLCPKCGRKSQRLYLPKSRDREPIYLCRWCHKLKPTSLLLGNQKKYTDVAKPLKRLELIKKRLLQKKLRDEEILKLLGEYDQIEKKLADSPIYLLWKFKREHAKDP
jgi:hypothetical protein